MQRSLSEQEQFWQGSFGSQYIQRNEDEALLRSNVAFFGKVLGGVPAIRSIIELGANIGMNLRALHALYPDVALTGVEINTEACARLATQPGVQAVNASLYEMPAVNVHDLALIKGVLIHQAPDMLPQAYDTLYRLAGRYILLAEYYNPVPVALPYRGHEGKLFKRDFAGEMLDRFPDLRLRDYGFAYHRDNHFPQDDLNWFLLEKA